MKHLQKSHKNYLKRIEFPREIAVKSAVKQAVKVQVKN